MINFDFLIDGRGCFPKEIVKRIMTYRGISYGVKEFCEPSSEYMLPLDSFKDIHTAADIYISAIKNNKKIGVLFDVDADGISAGTIITRYSKDLGCDVDTFINHGKSHGVSREESYYESLKQYDLLIIVDSLNNGIEEYKELTENGVNILVLDHHNIDKNIPYSDYITLVSSMEDGYGNHELSGAGVVLKFCLMIDKLLGTNHADRYYELGAIGIIADVMDMTSMENRYIAYRGLNNQINPCVKKILSGYKFNAKSVAYSVAPIINACNRMDENESIKDAFIEDDNKKILRYLRIAKKCKERQDELVEQVIPEAIKYYKDNSDNDCFVFSLVEESYGLNGLIAQKIASKYNLPTFVGVLQDGIVKGSFRSAKNVDLASVINTFGFAKAMGHEQSAGFELEFEKIDDFKIKLNEYLRPIIGQADETVVADVLIDYDDLCPSLYAEISKLDFISGKNFKPITFLVPDIDNYDVSSMKDGRHLKVSKYDVDFIKWNTKTPVDNYMLAEVMGEELVCVGSIDKSEFRGASKINLICDYIEIDR